MSGAAGVNEGSNCYVPMRSPSFTQYSGGVGVLGWRHSSGRLFIWLSVMLVGFSLMDVRS